MISWFKRWFTQTRLVTDEELLLRVRLLYSIAIIIVVIMLASLFGILIVRRTPILTIILDIIMLAIGLLSIYWLRQGRTRFVGVWLISAGFTVITALLVSLGSIRTPTATGYALAVIAAGILFDLPGIIVVSVASSLALLGIMLAGNAGLLPQPDFTTTITQWIIYTMLIGLAGGMTYFSQQLTIESLKRVRKEIDDRKRMEVEMRKLTQAVEQSPVSTMITDLRGSIQYVNPRFTQLTGYSPTDVIGQGPVMFKTGSGSDSLYRELWQTVSAGKEWRGEHVGQKKDGSYYTEFRQVSPIYAEDGTITNFLAITEDITNEKVLKENILRQRDLAQALAAATSIRSALELCLDQVMVGGDLDGGGIYLVNPLTRDLDLVSSKGMSEEFLSKGRHVPAGSKHWQIVMSGKVYYTNHAEILSSNITSAVREGLRTYGLVPVTCQGEVIACFNLASHTHDEISVPGQAIVEAIALQVGNALMRIQAQEELQQSHDRLAESEARFRTLFEQNHDAVFMFDTRGNFFAANQRASDMLGYTPEEILQLKMLELLAETGPAENVTTRLLAGETLPFFETLLPKKNGSPLPVEVSLELARDKKDQPVHIQSVVRDISQRKQAETALQESEKRYRLISENTADVISVMDTETLKFTYVSPSVWRLRGFTAREALAQPASATLTPASLKYLQEVMPMRIAAFEASGDPKFNFVDEFDVFHKDGRQIHTEATFSFIVDGTASLKILSVSRDITERKLAEAELLAAHNELEQRVVERTAELSASNRALEKAVRSRDEFLAAMSHELRTPLTGILGLAQVLQMQAYGPLSEKQLVALANIERSGQNLLDLINDILEYSSLQSDRYVLYRMHCSVLDVCRSALIAVAPLATQKEQRTSLKVEPEILVAHVDLASVKKILKHLLNNASKFTPPGGEFGIEAVAQPEQGHVRITVWDTGIGIEEQAIPQLFQIFVQLDARLSRQFGGLGLGLAMVKKLAELHGGRVEVESTFGKGSRFSVFLPLDE